MSGTYTSHCSYEGDGGIYNAAGELWQVKTLHPGGKRFPHSFFKIPDFLVSDKSGKEIFRINCDRRWPLASFTMIEKDAPLCSIRLQSVLRNKYTLHFANGQKWIYHMPLFTVIFKGTSEAGGQIHVRLRTHQVWQIWVTPESDTPELIAAIAFLHRERLRFN